MKITKIFKQYKGEDVWVEVSDEKFIEETEGKGYWNKHTAWDTLAINGGLATPFCLYKVEIVECEHKNTEWIPAEPDINVGEDVLCDDCGKSIIDELDPYESKISIILRNDIAKKRRNARHNR